MDSPLLLHILVVEDKPKIAYMFKLLLEAECSASVEIAEDCASARKMFGSATFDIITLDYQLPDGDGLELLHEINSMDSPPPVIMVTGHGDENIAADSLKLGAYGYVVKNRRLSTLLPRTIRSVLEKEGYRKKLVKSERDYRELVEISRSIILKTDTGGNITFINRFGREFFGYSEEELVGRNVVGTIVPEVESTGRDLTEMVSHIMADPDAYHPNLNENMRRDGERVWVLWTNRSIRDESGNLIGTLTIGNDMTRERLAENALRELVERYEVVSNFTYDWEWWLAPAGEYLYISPSCERITGHSRDEFMDEPGLFLSIVHPEDREAVEKHLEKAGSAREPLVIGFRIIRPDGSMRWIEQWCQQVLDPSGKALGSRASNRDVTNLNHAEVALRESLMLLEETGRMARVGGWTFDIATMEGTWTSEVYRIHELDESIKPTVELGISFFPPESEPVIREVVRRAIDYGETYDVELPFVTAKGNPLWVRSIGRADQEQGKTTRVHGTIQDITGHKLAEEALRGNDARLKAMTRGAMDAIILIDNRITICNWNPAAEHLLGFTEEEAIGESIAIIIPGPGRQTRISNIERFINSGHRTNTGKEPSEMSFIGKHGTEFPAEVSVSRLRIGDEWYAEIIARDITGRKKVEAVLRESEKKFKEFADNLPEVVAETDSLGKCLFLNANGIKTFGYTKEELYSGSVNVLEMLVEEDRGRAARVMQKMLSNGGPRGSREYTARRKDGTVFPALISTLPVIRDGVAVGLRIVLTDTTAQKKAEEEVKSLASRLMEEDEKVRATVAADLHDDVGQLLITAKLAFDMHRKKMARIVDDETVKGMANIRDMLLEAIGKVRNISTQLLPVELTDSGLDKALRDYLEAFARDTGITCAFKTKGPRVQAEIEVKLALFRIAQEALANIRRHAKAGSVKVSISWCESLVSLSVSDDGTGFDVEKVKKNRTGQHFGLVAMRERARVLEGEFNVESTPGEGTTVTVSVPLERG